MGCDAGWDPEKFCNACLTECANGGRRTESWSCVCDCTSGWAGDDCSVNACKVSAESAIPINVVGYVHDKTHHTFLIRSGASFAGQYHPSHDFNTYIVMPGGKIQCHNDSDTFHGMGEFNTIWAQKGAELDLASCGAGTSTVVHTASAGMVAALVAASFDVAPHICSAITVSEVPSCKAACYNGGSPLPDCSQSECRRCDFGLDPADKCRVCIESACGAHGTMETSTSDVNPFNRQCRCT